MNIQEILKTLKQERAKIEVTITALEKLLVVPVIETPKLLPKQQPEPIKRRQMSPANRKKLSRLMKARWNARRRANKASHGREPIRLVKAA